MVCDASEHLFSVINTKLQTFLCVLISDSGKLVVTIKFFIVGALELKSSFHNFACFLIPSE